MILDLLRRRAPLDAAFRRDPRLRWRRVDGGVAVLDEAEGQLIHFSEVGARIWELIDGRSARQIAATLAREYDAPLRRLERDAARFLKDLERRELIARAEPSA